MKTTILTPTAEHLELAAKALCSGEVVGMPTETVYGLAANALDPQAVNAIFAVKGRPADNPLIVHISDLSELQKVVSHFSETASKLAQAFWPGPLTMILPRHPQIPDVVTAGLNTVGVRMPSDQTACALIAAAGVPLAAPSANTSGKPSPTSAEHVYHDLNGKLRYIIDGGNCTVGLESTVALIGDDTVTILRPGAVTEEDFKKIVANVTTDPAVLEGVQDATQPVASPGMKYKHYAPAAALTLVQGGFAGFYQVAANSAEEQSGVLVFEGEERFFDCPAFTYGKEGDSDSQAEELFGALRAIDESGCRQVFVRMPKTDGVGMAVYNRLLRACAFRQIQAENLFVLGLTGPTGSGKSVAAKLFAEQFGTVLDCDRISREVAAEKQVLRQLAAAFGEDVVSSGVLDRKLLADRAFADEAHHAMLDGIMYPAITKSLLEALKHQQGMVLIDAPTLFESGAQILCDAVLAVLAPPSVRLERILKRDGVTEEQAVARMRVQQQDSYYRDRADAVLVNDTEVNNLLKKAGELFGSFQKAKKV